jgi:tetratricopeptide (TPR) repeat protein
MGRRSSIRLLSFFAVCFALKGQATTIPDIVAKAKPAVVQVIALDANWSPIRTGTGFFVSADGELLTNFHVIRGATHISARTNKGAIFVFEKLIAGSADSDVAFLKFEATDVDYLKVGSSAEAVEGETVLVIGNPEGLQGTVSNGIISAFRENRAYIQITAPISPGSSGSPVLDGTGQVIGMATLVAKEGQNLNFAISAEVIEKVIRPTLAQVTSSPSATPNGGSGPDDVLPDYIADLAVADYDKAFADSSKAIQLKPNDAEAYFGRAQANEGLGRFDEAIADYSEAIRLKPNDSSGYYNRARAYDSVAVKLFFDPNALSSKDPHEQFSKAIADYTEAIRLKPDNEEAFYYRAQDYSQFQQFDKAVADCTEAIRLKPDFADAYFWRGSAYKDLGKYSEAIADSTETIRLKPDSADAYSLRGDAFYRLRQYGRAIADESEAIRLKPIYALTYFTRGNAYNDLKQYESAVSDYTKVIRGLPNYGDAYRNRGSAYYSLGKYDSAVTDCTEAIRLNPKDAYTYYLRGTAYEELKDHYKAVGDFSEAAGLSPDNPDIYNRRGLAYLNL